MPLKHLDILLPSFISEIEKDAGVKDSLKAGTKKITNALKSIGDRTNQATLKATSKIPLKVLLKGHEALKIMSGHSV